MKKNYGFSIILISLLLFTGLGLAESYTIVDDAQKTIIIESEPQRIVSLAPSVTEILFALGLGEKIVGNTLFCDYPASALEIKKVGDVEIDLEALALVEPDIIFTMWREEEVVNKIRDLGFQIIIVEPQNIEQVLNWITIIGELMGIEKEAETLTSYLLERMGRVIYLVEQETENPKVFYEVWGDPLMSAGPGTFIHDLITLAGGINIAEDLRGGFAVFSEENVFLANPDIILLPWDNVDEVSNRQGWQHLNALKNNRLEVISDDLTMRPGPRIIDGLELMYQLFYSGEN